MVKHSDTEMHLALNRALLENDIDGLFEQLGIYMRDKDLFATSINLSNIPTLQIPTTSLAGK